MCLELACRYVRRFSNRARKQVLIAPKVGRLDPSCYGCSRRFRESELDMALRLSLNHHGSAENQLHVGNVAHARAPADEIAATQLAFPGC